MSRVRLFVAALFAMLLLAPAGANAADQVANPGSFTAEINGGVLKIGEFVLPINEIEPAPTLSGTVSPNGNIVIPSSGVHFDPIIEILEGAEVRIYVMATGTDWTGNINPDTGEFTLNARLRVKAEGRPLGADLGSSCYVGASGTGNNIWLNPATTGSIPANPPAAAMTGSAYDSETGEMTVVNNTVTVPGADGCGPLGLANGPVNDALGLPSSSGNATMELGIKFTTNAPQPPVVSRYEADPENGRVPFTVNFDASASSSTIGPITEYAWDYNGDGEVDETTTSPTTSHLYETAGVYKPLLTVKAGDFVTTRHRPTTITARAVVVNFSEKPPAFSQSRDADFAFEANEEGATLECRLDVNGTPGEFEACTSPVSFTELPDADYRYQVRAIASDSSIGLPTVWDFRVDNVAPDAIITGKPADRVNGSSSTGQVTFDASEPGSTFECRYTPVREAPAEPVEEEPTEDPFTPCTSPVQVDWDLVDNGVNKFEVIATDRAGNVGTITSATWIVDITPPVTTGIQTPPNPTNQVGGANTRVCPAPDLGGIACTLGIVDWQDTANPGNPAHGFTWSVSEPVVSPSICQFNNLAERPCVSGIQTGLGIQEGQPVGNGGERRLGTPTEGVNTLRVWSTDLAGNKQPNPTVMTFRFDTQPPVITALAGPDAFTKNTNQTVIFQSDEPATNFECRVVNNTGSGTTAFANNVTGFAPCSPGQLNPTLGWYQVTGQTDGRKGLQVRATDMAGNSHSTAALVTSRGLTRYWTVDTTAPTASFGANSQQQGSYTKSTSATFNLAAADTPINFGVTANSITAQQPIYECSLNNAPFTVCSTPVNLTGLTPGAKSFRVQVKDQAGNVTVTPIERTWTVVDNSNASVTLNSTPPAVSGDRDVTYQFAPDNGTAECRINPTELNNSGGTGWSACTSPKTFTGLADGNHQVEIRANTGAVPAVHNFAVYATAPTATFSSQPGIARPDGVRYTGLNTDSASIVFGAPANPAYAPGATTFECRYFETTATVPPFEPCSSPENVNWNEMADGKTMRFEVRPTSSTGKVGNVITANWTIVATTPAVAWGNNGSVATACGTGLAGGPGAAGCVATGTSTQVGLRSNVAAPRFMATSSKPITNAVGFACQLNNNAVQNPCTQRTSGFTTTSLIVLMGGSRGNSDNLGNAIVQNGSNTFKVWAVDAGGNMSAPIEYTWIHDNTPPGFAVSSPPASRIKANDVSFDILANEDIRAASGFKCRHTAPPTAAPTQGGNPSAWANCTTVVDARNATWTGTGLAEGLHTIDIKGYDVLDQANTANTVPNAADNNVVGKRIQFTIDRTAPTTTINGGPADGATVGQNAATFTWTTSEPASTAGSECRIDPADPLDLEGGWEPCASPLELTDLADGSHTIQVRSWDTVDNRAETPAQRTWTIDSTKPEIELKSNLESTPTKETSIVIGQLADPDDATVECRLLTPADLATPEEGSEPLPEVEWTNDCGEVIVEEPPVEEPPVEEPPVEEPPVEEPPVEEPVEPDPFRYLTYENLSDGDYKFQIRATNALTVVSDVSELEWTVDTVAPEVSIDSGPDGATKATTAEFEFSSDDADATFSCSLDEGDAEACESPVSFESLDDGDHSISVTATDEAGNVSEPADQSWSIDTVAPVASITSGPTGTVEATTASFAFNADKAGSTFECRLDNGAFAACTSPKAFNAVAVGAHTFEVKATDTLGNVGEAVTRSWTVKAPEVCPTGTTGTPPNCVQDKCPEGEEGTPPNCTKIVTPPTPAAFGPLKVSGKKKIKSGKKVTITVTVTNTGQAALSNAKVCVKTPKKLAAGKTLRCKTVASIAGGASSKVSFPVKTKKIKTAKKKAKLNFTVSASAAGVTSAKSVKGHVTVLK